MQLANTKEEVSKYLLLTAVKMRSPVLFYRVLLDNLAEYLPIVYTPTVGLACQQFSSLFRAPDGLYINLSMQGRILASLESLKKEKPDVEVIVVTDGSRILGLGDLGVGGIPIPIGKLALYVTCGGIHPSRTLPIILDVGTNNKDLLVDPFYLGLPRPRVGDDEYFPFCDEFVNAIRTLYPNAFLQFEDFSTEHAFELLRLYRYKTLCFNDDIQGTAGIVVASLINAMRILKAQLHRQKILFYGAGSAATGILDLLAFYIKELNMQSSTENNPFYLIDSKGLIVSSRGDLQGYKKNFARTDITEHITDLLAIVQKIQPTVLIGVSAHTGAFTPEVMEYMATYCTPVILPLSNPTSKAECQAIDAIRATKGRVLCATGSASTTLEYEGRTLKIGQANNMYLFPGIGLGCTVGKVTLVSDLQVIRGAEALAEMVTREDLDSGCLFPDIAQARMIATNVAAAVIRQAARDGCCGAALVAAADDESLKNIITASMYIPAYNSSSRV